VITVTRNEPDLKWQAYLEPWMAPNEIDAVLAAGAGEGRIMRTPFDLPISAIGIQ